MPGFAFRSGPSVRVAKLSRGVRVSVGPRGARLHVGAGTRPTVSSGAGPLTAWRGVGSRTTRPAAHTPAGRATHHATVKRRSVGEVVASVFFTLLFAAIGAFCFWLGSYAGGGVHWPWALGGAAFGAVFGHVLFAVEHERSEQ